MFEGMMCIYDIRVKGQSMQNGSSILCRKETRDDDEVV